MQTISLLLIERTQADLDRLCDCLSKNPAFHIAGCCTNVRQAFAMIQLYHPDVILCEIFLQGQDGLTLLQRMPATAYRPLLVMMSNLASDCILQQIALHGADYFICKPIDAMRLEQTILMLSESSRSLLHAEAPADITPRIHQLLVRSGFTSRYQGFHYLSTALLLLHNEPGLLSSLSKVLYLQVAQKHGTFPSRVERNIRHAVHGVCERTGILPVSNGTMLRQLLRRLNEELHGT